jgi:hypothetical protein
MLPPVNDGAKRSVKGGSGNSPPLGTPLCGTRPAGSARRRSAASGGARRRKAHADGRAGVGPRANKHARKLSAVAGNRFEHSSADGPGQKGPATSARRDGG